MRGDFDAEALLKYFDGMEKSARMIGGDGSAQLAGVDLGQILDAELSVTGGQYSSHATKVGLNGGTTV